MMKKGDKVIYQDDVYKIDDIDPDGNCIIETLKAYNVGVHCQPIVEYVHVRELEPVAPAGPVSRIIKEQDKENVKKSKDLVGTIRKIDKVLGKEVK